MTDTNLSNFVASCGSLVQTAILSPIVQYLTSKGVTVSVDELSQVLQLPASRPGPSMAFGGSTPSMTPTVTPSSSSSRKTSNVVDFLTPGKCAYQYKRGHNKLKYCGNDVASGSMYCSQCLKSRRGIGNDKAPTPNFTPGIAPGANNSGIPDNSAPVTNNAKSRQLTVEYLDKERGLLLDPSTGFVLTQLPTGAQVLGTYDKVNAKVVPLTTADANLARSIGLIVPDDIVSDQPQSVAPMQTTQPMQNMPPQQTMQSIQPIQQMPQPTTHQLPTQNVSQIPTMGGIPMPAPSQQVVDSNAMAQIPQAQMPQMPQPTQQMPLPQTTTQQLPTQNMPLAQTQTSLPQVQPQVSMPIVNQMAIPQTMS